MGKNKNLVILRQFFEFEGFFRYWAVFPAWKMALKIKNQQTTDINFLFLSDSYIFFNLPYNTAMYYDPRFLSCYPSAPKQFYRRHIVGNIPPWNFLTCSWFFVDCGCRCASCSRFVQYLSWFLGIVRDRIYAADALHRGVEWIDTWSSLCARPDRATESLFGRFVLSASSTAFPQILHETILCTRVQLDRVIWRLSRTISFRQHDLILFLENKKKWRN